MDGVIQLGPLMLASDRLFAVVALWLFLSFFNAFVMAASHILAQSLLGVSLSLIVPHVFDFKSHCSTTNEEFEQLYLTSVFIVFQKLVHHPCNSLWIKQQMSLESREDEGKL